MIRKADLKDLSAIKLLTEACALKMQQSGIFQWNEHYPSREGLQRDIEKGELYVLEERRELQGIVVLTTTIDKEYLPVEWLTPNDNNLYVHRLATNPDTWGRGNGGKLMDFAEECAREENFSSVRLDTFSQNQRNQQFYESRGYIKLGNIYFPKQSEHPFYCYEKILWSWQQ